MRKFLVKTTFVAIWILCLILRYETFDAGKNVFLGGFDGSEITACIADEVDIRNDGVRYVVEISGGGGRLLIYGEKYPLYEYGDCLKIRGKFVDPVNNGDFDYANYLKRYGIYKIGYADFLEKIDEAGGQIIFKKLYLFKALFEEQLDNIFVEPYKSFMAGLLMGSRRGLPQHLTDDFKTVGLSHIMAISGYNITLVIVLVSGFFWFLSKNIRVVVSSVFVIIFVIFVGMSASAVRAAIMGIIGLFALRCGRQYYASRGLLVATFFMSVWNPFILFFDAGFQLSALATLGLVYLYPLLEKRLKMVPEIFGIREVVGGSLSAQISVLPVLIWNFKQVSIVGVVANLFVLPLIPVTMLLGFLAVISGVLWSDLGRVIGFSAYLILKVIILIVELCAKMPFASVSF